MTDLEQYKNRSISSLVQQLNNLGNRQILTHNTQLFAIQKGENNFLKRFQTKSSPPKQFFKLIKQSDKKYFYDEIISDLNQNVMGKFMKNWQKNYNCSLVFKNNMTQLKKLLLVLQSWTNKSLVFGIVVNQRNEICDIFSQKKITHRQLLQNKKFYRLKQQSDSRLIQHSNSRINQKSNKRTQLTEEVLKYLDFAFQSSNQSEKHSNLINLTFKNPESCAQMNLTLLPTDFFSADCSPPFSLVKSQLLQLLNYFKMNPNKRYEHISKLITKRLPLTNYFTKILMNDSCNLIINHISTGYDQTQNQKNNLIGQFQFFDKLTVINNLLRKPDRQVLQIGIKHSLLDQSKQNKSIQNIQNKIDMIKSPHNNKIQNSRIQNKIKSQISPIAKLNQKTETFQIQNQNQSQYQNQMKIIQTKQFQYCRSLERKTHKYSVSPREQKNLLVHDNDKTNSKKMPYSFTQNQNINNLNDHKKTLTKYNKYGSNTFQYPYDPYLSTKQQLQNNQQNLEENPHTQSQTIALLKAQHTRQISQYHQTIQLLNKKIIILTKQLNLQELYKIHERQIMLLQLKIQQLREDIINLTKSDDEINQKSAKNIIRKLNQQIKSYETSSTNKKLTQGKFYMIQKQLKQTKQRLKTSQKARSVLTLQVQTLTKRLKIRDSQIQKINEDDLEKYKCQQLSVTEQTLLEDIKKLICAVKNQERNSVQYLMRKISLILSDLSKSRDIILQCNDFLVQLMQILDLKLNNKEPEIVLDCNKFIRTFLMENLSIF